MSDLYSVTLAIKILSNYQKKNQQIAIESYVL